MALKEISAPELTDDFKWRWAMENLKPQLEITGPSVGSLLYAMNPQTSELGLKQMTNELNQQMELNERFDKRGQEAVKFMENRVKEKIAADEFKEKMELEKFKAQNVDAGHANSLLSNYIQAIQSGDQTAIAVTEDRIRKVFPNAEDVLQNAQEQAAKGIVQDENAGELASRFPFRWNTRADKDNFKKDVEQAFKEGKINKKQRNELVGKANSITDRETYREDESFRARVSNAVNKNITTSNAKDKKTLIANYAKNNGLDLSKPNDRKQAEDWYKINYEGK